MKYGEIYEAPSEKSIISDFIDEIEREHPYKVIGNAESYGKYAEGWCDALDRIRSFINSM